MPIKPENRKRYPANWKDIRKDILKRADKKCEFCGIENYAIRENGSKVVLTIAHLEQMELNNKAVVEITGCSLRSSVRELEMAINHNAEVLREAVQKIEKLNEEVEQLKGGGVNGN